MVNCKNICNDDKLEIYGSWKKNVFENYVLQGGEAFRESAVQEAVWGVVKDAWPGEEALTGYEMMLMLLL